jgi:peroxiredoxin
LDYDLSKMDTARLGRLAPDFMLKDREGNDVRLSDFRGNSAVVLEFNNGNG